MTGYTTNSDDSPSGAPDTSFPSHPSGRPKVVIQDPDSPMQENPLTPYFIGACIIAGVFLLGLIVSFFYQNSKYNALQDEYAASTERMEARNAEFVELQNTLVSVQQELSLFKDGQANLTQAVVSARQNFTDKVNEVAQCQNALLLAQDEIKRLQSLEATKCDTLIGEVKSDCNLLLNSLFTNTTTACMQAVDESPNASGADIKKDVEKKVKLDQFTYK